MSLILPLLFLFAAPAESCERVDPMAFGLCDMFLGYGWTGESCEPVSGCSFVDETGVDRSEWIFPEFLECTSYCSPGITLLPPDPGTVGVRSALVVEGVPEGESVAVVFGLSMGETPVPGCALETVDLADPSLVGWAIADEWGTATVSAVFPRRAAGRDILFQAVVPATCEGSNLVEHEVP